MKKECIDKINALVEENNEHKPLKAELKPKIVAFVGNSKTKITFQTISKTGILKKNLKHETYKAPPKKLEKSRNDYIISEIPNVKTIEIISNNFINKKNKIITSKKNNKAEEAHQIKKLIEKPSQVISSEIHKEVPFILLYDMKQSHKY